MKIEVVKSGAPRPLANYSEAMVAGPWIFAAGQLASDFKTGVPEEARKHPNFPFYEIRYQASDPLRTGKS